MRRNNYKMEIRDNSNKPKMKLIPNFNVISIIAAISIVFLHFNAVLSDESNFIAFGTTYAVPTFFIISGYLYENSSNKWKNIKKSIMELVFVTIVLLCIISIFIEFDFNLRYSLFPYGGSLTPLWFYLHLIILKILYSNSKMSTKVWYFLIAIICSTLFGYSRTIYCSMIPFSFGIFLSKLRTYSSLKIGITSLVLFVILLYLNIYKVNSIQYSVYSSITGYFFFLSALYLPQLNSQKIIKLSAFSVNIYYLNFLIRNIIFSSIGYDSLIEAIIYALFCILLIYLFTKNYGKISYDNFWKNNSLKL